MSDEAPAAFANDRVTKYTPITFGLAFVRAMRTRDGISHVPSVRTSLALPQFLTARYFRLGTLSAKDYVEAAVLLTVPEDQGVAFEVARELLFPKDAKAPTAPAAAPAAIDGEVVTATTEDVDAGPSVLESLAGMSLDLDNLDLAALDRLMDAQIADATEMRALDLITELATSDDPAEQNLATLATTFGGVAELEADGIRDEPSARRFVLERLLGGLGELDAETIASATRAGFAPQIADGAAPWERAGMFAAAGDGPALNGLLDEVLATNTARDLGRALRFVRVANPATAPQFQTKALASARHLADWAEILDGLGAFVEPPADLIERSARDNVRRALFAAGTLDTAFRTSDSDGEAETERVALRDRVFDAWADSLTEPPPLEILVDVAVPSARWAKLTEQAIAAFIAALVADITPLAIDERMPRLGEALRMGRVLRETGSPVGRRGGAEIATVALELVASRSRFLPLLDAILDVGLIPHDTARVIAAGTALQIAEDEIYARLSQPLEQLRFLIESNSQDLRRHLELVDKITHIPPELLAELVACCVRDTNRMGLALLLAIALGPVANAGVPQQLIDDSLGYRGIGSGENLLLQWYTHRDNIAPAFKERVRALAKAALLEAALVWVHKGAGGAERGLLPQSRTRPYRAGDDLDHLDIDGTLEALASSGKTVDQMSHEDLLVQETTSGRAGFGVLIDISGSMSGKDLAVCAIAVVMLMGRLKPEELALALFESNTHVVKTFASSRDLDEVAGDLLELRATGGTRVDSALRFVHDEFVSQSEQERRVLFLLSDFCFFESPDHLRPLLDQLRVLDIHFVGAGHGHVDRDVAALFGARLGGQVTRIPSLAKLPELLLQALAWIAAGAQ